MRSPDTQSAFDSNERSILLELAQRSIFHGLERSSRVHINPADHTEKLQQKRASFVTLNRFGNLRGCIGHLKAIQPLAVDVSENAYSAAFRDPRFSPLDRNELEGLELHISVLTPATRMNFGTEAELLEMIHPGADGLILKLEQQQGTFLPSVWESLPDARSFLGHLKVKAGLPQDFWSDEIKVFRYRTESFGSPFRTTAAG